MATMDYYYYYWRAIIIVFLLLSSSSYILMALISALKSFLIKIVNSAET